MLFKTKSLEDAIKEWKKSEAKEVKILPYKRYGIKLEYAFLALNPFILPARAMGIRAGCSSPLDAEAEIQQMLKEEHEKSKGKFKGEGRIYFPDKGKRYVEFSKTGKQLKEPEYIASKIRSNGLGVDFYKQLEFVGVIPGLPWEPKLKVD